MGHRPPGLRAQARHRPARRRSPSCARPAGCRATPIAPSPSTTGSRTATRRPSSATPTAWPGHSSSRASDRRVVAVVGDGALTGGMAYEALNNLGHSGKPRGHRPQRQRPLLRPDGLAPVLEPHPPPAQPGLHPGPPAHPPPPPRTARRRAIWPTRESTASPARCARWSRPTASSRRWASATPAPSTATTSPGWSRPWPTPSEWPGPIVVHVLTQKGRGYAPAEEDDVQRLHDFKVAAVPSVTAGCRSARDHLHRRLHPGTAPERRVRPTDRGHHRGHARPHRAPALRGRVPRPVPRRGHRRAARGDRRRRHGHGRAAPGGGRLLHLLQPGLRPGQPRRRAARPARGLRPRPGRHHR